MSTYEELKNKYMELNDEDLDSVLGGSRIITNTRYIVNGAKMDSVEGINTENIESIEILKGAAAAALYGSNHSNGVIMITTNYIEQN